MHAETAAFRAAGRRRHYADCVMVTTLSPCWYCSGLLRQFGIGTVVIGEAQQLRGRPRLGGRARMPGGAARRPECIELLGDFIASQSRALARGHRALAATGSRTRPRRPGRSKSSVRWPEQPVAGITESGHDEARLVQPGVDGGAADGTSGWAAPKAASPGSEAMMHSAITSAAPRSATRSHTCASEPPVASMGSQTIDLPLAQVSAAGG